MVFPMDNPLLQEMIEKFKQGYFFFENRYYQLLDKINNYVPIYKVIDPIDKVVPSFVLFLSLIFLLAIFFIFLSTISVALTATLQVVDNKGNSLDSVAIELTMDGETKQLLTDDWGEVQLDLPQEELEVEAAFSKEGFQNLERTVLLVADETASVTMQPSSAYLGPTGLEAERTIKVIDNSTNRLITKKVTITFECSAGLAPLPQEGTTGEFKVMQPSNCPTLIATAEADGYTKKSKTLASKVNYIMLSSNISGTTGNINVTVNDTAGNAEANVVARAIDEARNIEVGSTITALSGTALLKNLQPGSYTVSVAAPDGRTGQERGVSVTVGQTATVTIVLPSADDADIKKIYLKLVEQGTTNPVAEAQAFIYEDNVLVDSTTSDSLGIVEKRLAAAEAIYLVVLTHPNFNKKVEPNVPLKELSDTDPISVAMVRASMQDPATSAEAVVTVVDEALKAVKDALVSIYDSRYAEIPLKTPPGRTLEDGTYTFVNLEPGTYFAKASNEAGSAEGESDPTAIAAGETAELQVILILGEGTIEATVYDDESASDDPIAGATVQFLDASEATTVLASCTTDSRGKCESEPIAADRFVDVKASAAGFVPGYAISTVDVVNRNPSKVRIGLMHKSSIPPGIGDLDVRFVAFCDDKDCKKLSGKIQSDEEGTNSYFAKFELVFASDVQYAGTVQHVRVGPDSEIDLPLPHDYKIKISAATGPLFNSAALANCWNNDASYPFMEPAGCSIDQDAKQVTISYPDLSGMQIVPFVVQFDVEQGLAAGTRLEMHFMAKSTVGEEEVLTGQKVKYFSIDEFLCEDKDFAWGFKLVKQDGSTTVLDTAPETYNDATVNEAYKLSYSVYNCTNRVFPSSQITAKNLAPEAISFEQFAPFDFGPVNAYSEESFSFGRDSEISYQLPIYTVTETPATKLELVLVADSVRSIEEIGFSVEGNKQLRVDYSPQKLPNYGTPTLSGRVKDALAVPEINIRNALATLQISEGVTRTATTGEEGLFTINDIDGLHGLSSVTLTVRAAGYKTFTKEIEVGTTPPIPNPSLVCISIEKAGSETTEIYFEKDLSNPETDTFTVKNGCSAGVVIHLDSELKISPSEDFTLAQGDSRQVTAYAETTLNSPYEIAIGEYGIGVMARFETDDPLAGFAGPIQTARIYVTDPNSCFRLADPMNPRIGDPNAVSDPAAMKSAFDIKGGLDNGLIVNECFEYFEDLSLPRLDKVYGFLPVEEVFSLVYEPPTLYPGVLVEKQKVLDPSAKNFNEEKKFVFNLLDSGGYVFVDWVDFFMTDKSHPSGERHKVWAQTHRNVWSNITSQLPYTTASSSLPHPIVDNSGWVDTDTYYRQGATYNDQITRNPMWQGQHNVCATNLGGFGSTLPACKVTGYFGGDPTIPYKIGHIANKIALEVDGSTATKITAIRWHYTRTDKSHGGQIDFKIQNNTLMGETYALIEAKDTVGTYFVIGEREGVSAEGDTVVGWNLSKSGDLIKSNLFSPLTSTVTIEPGGMLGISVNFSSGRVASKVFDSNATLSDVSNSLPVAPREITAMTFTSNPDTAEFHREEGEKIQLYKYTDGEWSDLILEFDVDEPGATESLDNLEPDNVEVFAFKNNSNTNFMVDDITLTYLIREQKTVELESGEAVIPLGESSVAFDTPVSDNDLPPAGPLDYYDPASIEYIVDDTNPNAIVYFNNTKLASSPNPYDPRDQIVVAISTPTEEANTKTERFHVRLIGESQDQCLSYGGLKGSTGVGSKPRVLLDWDWNSISIDSCNSDNQNFVYCDPTQFTVSLVKRLELMRQLAEEDITGNLLQLREMQQFNVYLIEDAYTADFRHDFVEFFSAKMFEDELANPEHPWSNYLLDADRLVFETSGARLPTDPQADPDSKFIAAGLHEIYLDLKFDEDQFDFFYIQDVTDLLANITVYITKISDPIIQNPFYYLPFNGSLGKLDSGEFDRVGYGLVFNNSGEPLAIVSDIGGAFYTTDSPPGSTGRKPVGTYKESDFGVVNREQRGIIMKVAQDQSQIDFAPSTATPVLLETIPENGRVEAYYWLRSDPGGLITSTASFMNLWNGSGSTMRPSEGVCLDFYGSMLQYRVQDRKTLSGCAASVLGSHGFTYDPAADTEQLYFETVFYTPKDMVVHLRKSCQNNSYFYAPGPAGPQRTDTTDTPVSLSIEKSMTRAVTMDDVVNLIADEYVCISADEESFSFWWNPQKVLTDLDDVKKSINSSWEWQLSCDVLSS